MRFDDYWNDDDAIYDDGGGEKAMVPDGRHTGEIVDAKVKSLPFLKNDKNPDGRGIVVTIAIPKYAPIESIIPANFRGKVEALCRAAGVPLPARGQEWSEECLIGRTVTVETVLAVSKAGRDYVRVDRWHASPSQPLPDAKPAAKPVARSQAAKAHAAFTSNAQAADDIPF